MSPETEHDVYARLPAETPSSNPTLPDVYRYRDGKEVVTLCMLCARTWRAEGGRLTVIGASRCKLCPGCKEAR